jgi:membrane-associated protease RseP (regulator of RpoE activity)
MTETPDGKKMPFVFQQSDFEKITTLVAAEFRVEESLMENGIPTYHLRQPQETKQPFLRLLKSLNSINLIAILRKIDGTIALRVIPKPPVKPSNIMINWILLLATVATTFITGYMLSLVGTNPFISGAAFTIAIMTILGTHEMGHKLTADRKGIDATPPYFIPGPPPIGQVLGIGTFGAVIMQKSLPPNKDSLFDIGANGPLIGFILATIVSIIGLLISPMYPLTGNEVSVQAPLIFELFAMFIVRIPSGYYMLLHPVAIAGWVGMLVTMLNLLPAAMLDGGHVSRSLFGERARSLLTFLSIVLLVAGDFWPMAIFVLFISMYKHPGPLDDVSALSTSRKLLAIVLIVVFVLCSYLHYYVLALLQLLGL